MKYFDALRVYNDKYNNGSWCVYKKGSNEYNDILKIMKGGVIEDRVDVNTNAIKIQSAIRNKLARKKVSDVRDSSYIPKIDDAKTRALIKIQSAIRNKKAYDKAYDLNKYLIGDKLINFNDNPKSLTADEYVEYKNNLKTDVNKYLPIYIKKLSFEQILSVLDYSRKDIKALNIFLTPVDNVNSLVDYSGYSSITNNKRLNILEPTAGTGNIIRRLVDSRFFQYHIVDAIEPVNALYNIGKTIFKNYRNVHWFNMSFFDYKPDKRYDYIFMNPPFNINIKGKKVLDIDFVNYAYSLLKDDGTIAAIISASFLQKNNLKNKKYNSFNKNIENISNIYELDEGFNVDYTTVKEMQTNVKMVYITIDKDEDIPTLID